VRKKVVIPKRETKQVFSMRLKPTRKDALQKAAVKHGCAMNSLLEVIIDEWLREQGFLK
jgi:predicted HicB family RNase H-like nuclease